MPPLQAIPITIPRLDAFMAAGIMQARAATGKEEGAAMVAMVGMAAPMDAAGVVVARAGYSITASCGWWCWR